MNDLNASFLPQARISPIEDIIEDIRAGRMVVIVDEEDRENEGDLLFAAEYVTPEHINFMATYGRGLICLTLTQARCQQLGLALMVEHNGASMGTNFTASIEAAHGVTTGISTADRAWTIKTAVQRNASADDVVSPGHIFPLIAQNDGVLVRAGHTEAGCDLARLAGLEPAAVICEILNEDGNMARLPDLLQFAIEHGLRIGTIADLIEYRSQTETLITRTAEKQINTAWGQFRLLAYLDRTTQETHIALVKGTPDYASETVVRVHELVTVLDILDSDSKQHSWSIPRALEYIQHVESGVLVMLCRKLDGSEMLSALCQPEISARPSHTLLDYGIGAQILRDIGVGKMRLLAQPRKMPSMAGFGLEIMGFISG